MGDYQDLTIAVSESGVSWMGKWAASLVASTDLDAGDESILSRLTGYGATPLEAAANLLAMANKESASGASRDSNGAWSVVDMPPIDDTVQ